MFKFMILIFFCMLHLNAMEKLKIGVLAYGTVNWELKTLKDNKLDLKNGYELEFVKLASKNAQLIALQSGSVDIIVNDWIWVNSQRYTGKNFSFYPYSRATGTIYSNIENNYKSLLDLKDKSVGISGGFNDKTWLILRAYTKKKYNIDLFDIVNPVYAGAPILYRKILDNSLDAAVNYWHYNARLKSLGVKSIIEIKDVLKYLNIKSDLSFVGWVFKEEFANKNKQLINSFIKSTHESKNLLLKNENAWENIKSIMKVKSDTEFESLKDGYRKGVIFDFNEENIIASNDMFNILVKEGGKKLVGKAKTLDPKIFWKY